MTINFNKNIYPLIAIKKTVKAYKDLAKFKIIYPERSRRTEKNKYILVELTDIKKEVKSIIKDEFCNYVLSQVKQ